MVVVNKDTKSEQRAVVTLPREWRTPGTSIYDLATLEPISGNPKAIEIDALAAGDGRTYLVSTAREFERVKRIIWEQGVRETLRSQMPDLAIARHYKADVRKIEELRSAATHQRMSSKVDLAKQAAQLLNTLLSKLTPYAGLRKQLSDTGKLMGSVEIAMYPENPTWGEKMAAVRGPFWACRALVGSAGTNHHCRHERSGRGNPKHRR